MHDSSGDAATRVPTNYANHRGQQPQGTHAAVLPPAVAPLLTERDLRALLGGMGERKFHELRAAGIVPEPIELGPRSARWTHADYLTILDRLPRRQRQAEPQTLAEGRRARIEKLKTVAATVPATAAAEQRAAPARGPIDVREVIGRGRSR